MTSRDLTIVLVHGAFADSSVWWGVIQELHADGFRVVATPNPLRGLAADAGSVRSRVVGIDGPVLLVGHSYGGAVITEASAGLDHVVGLVYLAAFGIDVGESADDVQSRFPPTLLSRTEVVISDDAPGAVDGPDVVISVDGFRETFCADVPVRLAEAMCATQRPLARRARADKATAAGWHATPSWYLVSENDRSISPEAQGFMAQRMQATTATIAGSHAAFVAQPVVAAAFIAGAAAACG